MPQTIRYVPVPEYSVRDYGADPTGVADSTSAIQKCITQALTGSGTFGTGNGGIIYFGPGTFKVSATITASDAIRNLILQGAGMGVTVIQPVGIGANGVFSLSASSMGKVSLRDMSIAGASNPGSRTAAQVGILLGGGGVQRPVSIEHVEIYWMADDAILHQGNSSVVRVHDCWIHDNNYGWAINGNGGTAAIQNFVADSCSLFANDGGIRIASSLGCTIQNCDVEGGSPSKAMLNLTGSSIWCIGNTCSLSATATASDCVTISGAQVHLIGGVYNTNVASTNCIHVTGTAATAVLFGPSVSGGGAATTVGILIDSGATDTLVALPNYNALATNITNNGTRTVQFGQATSQSGPTTINGLLTVTNGINLNAGQMAIPDGTAAAPALTFANQANNGLYRAGGNKLGIAVAGVETIEVNTSGLQILVGALITLASTTAGAGFRLPAGTAPTSPVDGDIWYDGTNLKVRLAGATKTVTVF
jgi:hypothetical protein